VRFFLIGLIIFVLSSCLSDPNCIITASNEIKIQFKKKGTDSLKFVTFPSITSSGTDKTTSMDSATAIRLYVNPRDTTTTFKFQHDGIEDTLRIKYFQQTIVISPECGAYTFYSHLAVDGYSFAGTVRVLNAQLSTVNVVNLEIKY
jgi:hypothetical protein